MYEIGLVQFYWGPADEVVGPYLTLAIANEEACRRNKELGIILPGHGKKGWMVADYQEIPRKSGCVETKPE